LIRINIRNREKFLDKKTIKRKNRIENNLPWMERNFLRVTIKGQEGLVAHWHFQDLVYL